MKKSYDLTLAQQFSSNSCCCEPNLFHDDDAVLDASDIVVHIYYRKFIRAMRLKLYVPYSLGKPIEWKHAAKDIGIVAISANDAANYPQDAPEKLREMATTEGFLFPLCYDETQETAKAYTAACTPDFFLFDAEFALVYRGQLDDSHPSNNQPVTGADLRAAMDALLAGKPVNPDQKPSIGCNIKWKPGNEPPYYG